METVYILRKLPFTSVKKTSPQIMHLPPSPPKSLRGVRFFGVNILPWKMVTGLSVRSRPSTLMEGAVFFFSNLTTGGAIFRSSFSSIWRCSASPTLLSSVTLGFTPVWAAMRSASRRSNCISCKNFVPWQTPMVMFWPVMVMRQRSRKPLMGTPSRFISSIISRRPASSSVA